MDNGRMIVVLLAHLRSQLKRAKREYEKLNSKGGVENLTRPQCKRLFRLQESTTRLQAAIYHLGEIQLGDIDGANISIK